MTSGTALASAATLADLRRARAAADAAEVEVVQYALEWAGQHTIDPDSADVATWGDAPVPLAGQGAQQVSEFCVAELAAALGVSTDSGRLLMSRALELGHRLPRIWARVQEGAIPTWRAGKIADRTLTLSPETAAYVDAQAAPFLGRVSMAALDRLIETAKARYMPEEAERIAEEAADTRHVSIDHDAAFTGLAYLTIKPVIDLAEEISTTAYAIPDRLREQVVLRDRRHCVFPWCERPARSCDLDHVKAYDAGGPTTSSNLAPLCRRHHRVKTHGKWTYLVIEPGTYLWRSPHGYTFLRDHTGTRDLTPRPVDPPG